MADMNTLGNAIQYDTQTVQGVADVVLFMLLGLVIGGIVLFLLWKLFKRLTYNYDVTVVEKVGNGEIQFKTRAKEIKDSTGNHMIDYLGIGQSQRWQDFADYLRTIRGTMLGFMPTYARGFTVYKIGSKIIPIKVQNNPGLIPIDYDMFNYMQWKVIQIRDKYTKQDRLMQLLPIIGLGMVVLAFIMGSFFWGKHVENVATMIIGKASEVAAQYSGAQVIQ